VKEVTVISWYVVHTQPKAELKALWHLENQGFHCFLPKVMEVKRHARQAKSVLVPLFPRYLFIRLDLDVTGWRAVNGTRGVVNLVANGKTPLAVPHGVVTALLAKCDQAGVTSLASMGLLTEGLAVKIKGGAFEGHTGRLEKMFAAGQDRVQVLLTLLGVETVLHLPLHAIEAA
jgi:transcriptional antiterminator RfaH